MYQTVHPTSYLFIYIYSVHWYLAVVCYPSLLLASRQSNDDKERHRVILDGDTISKPEQKQSCILIFDSLSDRRRDPRFFAQFNSKTKSLDIIFFQESDKFFILYKMIQISLL